MGTRCHHLALYVVYDNLRPMVSDTPTAYEGQTGFEFLAEVPVTWDQTRFLAGEPGQFVVVARRKGNTWYLGGITNGTTREITVPLDMLDDGSYEAKMFVDGSMDEAKPNAIEPKRRGDRHDRDTAEDRDGPRRRVRPGYDSSGIGSGARCHRRESAQGDGGLRGPGPAARAVSSNRPWPAATIAKSHEGRDSDAWFANYDVGQYVRTETNDGRKEHVLADLKGPGTISRFWSANPRYDQRHAVLFRR